MTAIVVVSFLMISTANIIFASVDSYLASAARSRLTADLSVAMEQASAALRDIPLDSSQAGAVPAISAVSASSLNWSADSSLTLSGTSLVLNTAGTPRTLMSGVTSFALAAWNDAGSALSLPLSGAGCQQVRRVELTISASRSGVSETLRTRVFLRNLIEGSSSN